MTSTTPVLMLSKLTKPQYCLIVSSMTSAHFFNLKLDPRPTLTYTTAVGADHLSPQPLSTFHSRSGANTSRSHFKMNRILAEFTNKKPC